MTPNHDKIDQVKLAIMRRDGTVQILYEDGTEKNVSHEEYEATVQQLKATMAPKLSQSMNPCSEIVLKESHQVQPWVQAHIFNGWRIHAGKTPLTNRELLLYIDSLKYQAEQADLEKQTTKAPESETTAFAVSLAAQLIRGSVMRGLNNAGLAVTTRKLLSQLNSIHCRCHVDADLVQAAKTWYDGLTDFDKSTMDAIFWSGASNRIGIRQGE